MKPFFGQDIDPLMVRLTEINCALYSLNSYGVKLAEAVHEALAARQSAPQVAQLPLPNSPQAALEQAARLYQPEHADTKLACPTFEELFKVTR